MNDKKYLDAIDLVSLFITIIVFSITINYMIDVKLLFCAICCVLFVVTFIVLTVIENFFNNKKLNNVLKMTYFMLLVTIILALFI